MGVSREWGKGEVYVGVRWVEGMSGGVFYMALHGKVEVAKDLDGEILELS